MIFVRKNTPCDSGLPYHFWADGICFGCKATIACCGNCRSSYTGRDPGTVGCGHGVDDEALRDEDASKNPVWATRKYGFAGMQAMFRGQPVEGADDEAMSTDDGRDCPMWAPREDVE